MFLVHIRESHVMFCGELQDVESAHGDILVCQVTSFITLQEMYHCKVLLDLRNHLYVIIECGKIKVCLARKQRSEFGF